MSDLDKIFSYVQKSSQGNGEEDGSQEGSNDNSQENENQRQNDEEQGFNQRESSDNVCVLHRLFPVAFLHSKN